MLDVEELIRWLGPAGTKAGLVASELSLDELIAIARSKKLSLSPKPTKLDVAYELAFSSTKKIDKPNQELLAMKFDELRAYLSKTKPSRTEIIGRLSDLGVSVSSEANKKLFEFAAREISELGMYERVAHGRKPK
jgi:hypothetical protein